MTEEEVRKIIREELADFMRIDKYSFSKNIQILDGRKIQVGKTTGTMIGTSGGINGQKLGFFGATPIYQPRKADHADWAALSNVVSALVDLGLLDQT